MYCDILKNVVGKTNRNIKNSTELVNKLRKVRLRITKLYRSMWSRNPQTFQMN